MNFILYLVIGLAVAGIALFLLLAHDMVKHLIEDSYQRGYTDGVKEWENT